MVLLKEDDVKKSFRECMLKRKTEFKTEVRFNNCIIDFLAKIDNKWAGIEVKGETNNIFTTLGQLVNYSKFISHIYLCAPASFIQKFEETYSDSAIFSKIKAKLGLIVLDGNSMKICKRAINEEYYMKLPKHSIRKHTHHKVPRDDAELDKTDEDILNFLKVKQVATVWDIIQNQGFDSIYKNPYETVNKRIKNLVHFGFVEIINKHPKTISLVNK